MRVFKRSDSKVYYLDYTDAQGNRVKESTGTTNKKEAQEILAKRKTDVIEGRFEIIRKEKTNKVTFKDLCGRYFDKAVNVRQSSLKRYRVSSNQLIPFFGETLITRITTEDIENYQSERIKAKKKASTVKADMSFLRHLLKMAKKWKLISESPMDDVDILKDDSMRTRFLTTDEAQRLLVECMRRPYLYHIVMIALNTGMRIGEIQSLQTMKEGEERDKVNWVDMENRCFHLNVTKNHKSREVPVNSELYGMLEKELKDREPGPLFKYRDIRDSFGTALRRAEIKNVVPHDLRRTFISHAMMSGYSQEVIQRVVGQEDPRIFKRYAYLTPDLKNKVVEDMGKIFSDISD